MKNLELVYFKHDYDISRWENRSSISQSLGITIKGDPKIVGTIANDISDAVWTAHGYSVSVKSGGKQYPDKVKIFLIQNRNDSKSFRYDRVQYSKAALAIYGILTSYGVKL